MVGTSMFSFTHSIYKSYPGLYFFHFYLNLRKLKQVPYLVIKNYLAEHIFNVFSHLLKLPYDGISKISVFIKKTLLLKFSTPALIWSPPIVPPIWNDANICTAGEANGGAACRFVRPRNFSLNTHGYSAHGGMEWGRVVV